MKFPLKIENLESAHQIFIKSNSSKKVAIGVEFQLSTYHYVEVVVVFFNVTVVVVFFLIRKTDSNANKGGGPSK